ncbi:MAG: hypothetical protein AVDCRST_MAG05-1946 [uncultured Rubrobacteraceae bacterium]|uniref:Uncharacterized protein n=1 Tax=uncultured Rubrobacteraceae bacterium TaxID=349277 RepID=A0A6J4SH73_9ACTN|nr:MAG: hypothetical protein AVDCRST_MAG05-1946 [uncultured Rubrobacteraceae bacterium]
MNDPYEGPRPSDDEPVDHASSGAAVWAAAESAANETRIEASTNPHTTTLIPRMIPLPRQPFALIPL